jgi:hypothetical protein
MPSPIAGKIFLGFTESEEEERLLLIAEGQGVDLKLPIGFSEELESGQLQLALEQPQIPITGYTLAFFGGRNSIFRTPAFCGDYPTEAAFTPWDEALSTQTAVVSFGINSGPGGSKCLGEAASVAVQLNPATILADGKSQTEVTVEIRDAEGAGLPEQEVELTSSDPAPADRRIDRQRRRHLQRQDHRIQPPGHRNDHRHRPLRQLEIQRLGLID